MGFFKGANNDTLCQLATSDCTQPATACYCSHSLHGDEPGLNLTRWHRSVEMELLIAVITATSGNTTESLMTLAGREWAQRSWRKNTSLPFQ